MELWKLGLNLRAYLAACRFGFAISKRVQRLKQMQEAVLSIHISFEYDEQSRSLRTVLQGRAGQKSDD
jgi:hypothetical protein